MNEVMFVTGGELLQFLPISSKKRVGMSICFFGHLKVSIRPRACFFPLFSFLPLWLHYNLNPLCVQY